MQPSDDALIAAYQAGDAAAFDALYARYEGRLFRFLLTLGGRKDAVEDVFQLTWLRAIERMPQYRGGERFRSWLFRIGHRLWLDDVRSARVTKRVDVDSAADESPGLALDRLLYDTAPGPDAVAASREQQTQLYRAMESLPDVLRQTLLLRIDAELRFREIAEQMGCPLGTALWRAKEAQRKLQNALGRTP